MKKREFTIKLKGNLLTIALIAFLAMFSSWQAKGQNYALNLAKTNQVTIGKPDYTSTAWTVELWVKKGQQIQHGTLLGGSKFKLNLDTWNNTGKVGFTKIGQSPADLTFNYSLPLNKWVHLAYIYKNNTISLCVNGVITQTLTHTINLPLNTIGLSGETAVAAIDEMRVWKTARTEQEITDNMNRSVNPLTETNLLAYWYFDDQAAAVSDISGNGNTGIINGATYISNDNPAFTTNLPPMSMKSVSCSHQNEYLATPASTNQELLRVEVTTSGIDNQLLMSSLKIGTDGSTNIDDIDKIAVYATGTSPVFDTATPLGAKQTAQNSLDFTGNVKLYPGVNYFWVAADVKSTATAGNVLDAAFKSAVINGQNYQPETQNPKGRRLIAHKPEVSEMPVQSIIPQPNSYVKGTGKFVINEQTQILVSAETRKEGEFLSQFMKNAAGFTIPVNDITGNAPSNAIVLNTTDALNTALGNEGYTLKVTPENISIEAKQSIGVFWGLQTLRQMLPPQVERGALVPDMEWAVQAATVSDVPRFAYRGVMLDVGRHIFPISFLKKHIDLLALYKINILHWHLTEDQGWRIEIKKYPKLTETAAWRTCDGVKYGGFYTQEEIKEIVAYAAERHIDIIPEIEMPGHSVGVLAAYPDLACTSAVGPFSVPCGWGVFNNIICGGKEATYTFLEDVLTEVIALFPYKYVHIGGDEAPKNNWNTCSDCQAKITGLGITGTNATDKSNKLQKYLVERIGQFLASKGRKLIGWDEITHGGLPAGATIQAWNPGVNATVIDAIKNGHDVIMSDYNSIYLSQRQSANPSEPQGPNAINTLDEVYNYEPVLNGIPADKVQHVLGAEGCLWTEWIKTPEHAEYMLNPRVQALAEMAWSKASQKNLTLFKQRLLPQFVRLSEMGQNFRRGELPAKVYRKLIISTPTQINAVTAGVSYFWNDNDFSRTRAITVSETGIYKCYVDYYGVLIEEIYDVTSTTGLENIKAESGALHISPNPNKGVFSLTIKDADVSGGTLTVFNSKGQTIDIQNINDLSTNKTVTLKNKKSGIYIVKFITDKKPYREYTAKLVVK